MLCKLLYYLKYNKHIRADSVSKRGTTLPGLSELVCCVQAGVGAARQGCPLSRASKCRLCSQVCACICALFASQQKTGAVDVFFFFLTTMQKMSKCWCQIVQPSSWDARSASWSGFTSRGAGIFHIHAHCPYGFCRALGFSGSACHWQPVPGLT